MKIIDITDFPEPVAKAIESMVDALRAEVATRPPGQVAVASNGIAEFDRALDELFAMDSHPLPSASLSYSRSDIYADHD